MFGGPPIYMPYQPPVVRRPPPQPVSQPRVPVAKPQPREVEFAAPDELGIQLDVTVPEPRELGIQLK